MPAIYGYSTTGNINQIGILGAYNGNVGYGAAMAAVGFNGNMPPAGKDIGLFASQHSAAGRALYVDGLLQIVDGLQENGKILTSDGNGNASWQKPAAAQHAFATRYYPSTFTLTSGVSATIPFDFEEYDYGNDISSGIFTAPDTGLYHFDASVVWSLSSSSSSYFLESYFYIDDNAGFFGYRLPNITIDDLSASFNGNFTQHISTDVHLDAGNTVKVVAFHNSSVDEKVVGNLGFFGGNYYSRFSGHKLF